MTDFTTVTNFTVSGRVNESERPTAKVFITYNADFSGNGAYELDFTIVNQAQTFGIPKSVFIDNGSNPSQMEVYVTSTDQFFVVPPFATGTFVLNAAITSKLQFSSAGGASDIVTITVYNHAVPPFIWYSYGTSSPSALNQSYGTMAEGADVASQIYNQPVFIGGIDRATGEFRGLSVDANGAINVISSFAGTINVSPIGGAWTDRSLATLSGASEQLMAANANRKYLLIQNISANNMGVNLTGGVAAIGAAGTYTLAPGASIELEGYVTTAEINIIGTLNDAVSAAEG